MLICFYYFQKQMWVPSTAAATGGMDSWDCQSQHTLRDYRTQLFTVRAPRTKNKHFQPTNTTTTQLTKQLKLTTNSVLTVPLYLQLSLSSLLATDSGIYRPLLLWEGLGKHGR